MSDGSVVIKKVVDLEQGDLLQGRDATLNLVDTCEVLHVTEWGTGPLYGNYTSNHFMLNLATSPPTVVEHGNDGTFTIEKKYTVLTSCPMAMDESGKVLLAYRRGH